MKMLHCFFYVLTFVLHSRSSIAVPATPFLFKRIQQGGGYTIDLQMHGDEFYHVITDTLGYIVMQDDLNRSVYGIVEDDTGEIIKTQAVVGEMDPRNVLELQKGLLKSRWSLIKAAHMRARKSRLRRIDVNSDMSEINPQRKERNRRHLRFQRDEHNQTLQNLVVLIKFRDHVKRKLPNRQMYDTLFNQVGGNATFAPTGSVKDLFLANSHGKLIINSTVLDWLQLPETESYYAENQSGLGNLLLEAMYTALEFIVDKKMVQMKDFDVDGDGFFDALTFIHSGFGAEWGEEDCDGKSKEYRIWSHHRNLSRREKSCAVGSVCIGGYQIASGLWGYCTDRIARVGVISHEIGHLLGLEDMYDVGGGGFGIGSYGLMGNCWGFDGNQLHPPLMDPWSKQKLGWITPTVLTASGKYFIEAVHITGQVYQIKQGFPRGEYLLIENRQPNAMESLPQGGLAIWHIDEKATFEDEGFPGQVGWPENGKHYKVALLQADGEFHLERGKGYGDGGDVWHADSAKEIGPSRRNNNNSTKPGPFPNTDSYRRGHIKQTGIIIREISKSAQKMSFDLVLPENKLSPTDRFLSWLATHFRRFC